MASPNEVRVSCTSEYSSRIANQFQQLRLDDEMTDFTIRSGKQTFSCHKVILAGNSPVLHAMVRSGMREASSNQADIDTIPPAVVQLVLDYMYKGETVIPHEHLPQTIEAADYLQLLELKEVCLGDAAPALKPSNIVSWSKLADRLDIEELKSKCVEIMSSSLAEISRFKEFQELNFAEVSSFVSSAQERDVDPDDLLDASMDWISSKPSRRIDCMEELLEKIQLLECSVECLENEIDTHEELLKSCPAGHSRITKTLLHMAKHDGARKKRGAKRNKNAVIVVVGGSQGDTPNKVCWELDASLQFIELCQIPGHTLRFGVCKVPEGFILTGGEDDCILCSMFILSTKSWKQLDPLKLAHGSIFAHGRIFVFGGTISESESASVHSLALDGGKWTEEPDLPTAVWFPEVASVQNNIFLLDIQTNQLLKMDVKNKTWSHQTKFPGDECWGARMVSTQDKVIVSAGICSVCAHYDPKTDTWCSLNSPTLEHNFGALVTLKQNVYLIGGEEEDRIEEYDIDSKTWAVYAGKVPKKLWNLHGLVFEI